MLKLLLHSYGEFSPSQPLVHTVWPHYDLLFIHEGSLKMQVAGIGSITLQAGDGILLFPETAFSPHGKNSKAKASVQHFSLSESVALPPPYSKLQREKSGAVVYRGGASQYLEADIHRSMEWARLPESAERTTMRQALLTIILGEFLQLQWKTVSVDCASDQASLLEWASHQPLAELSVEALAEAAGVSEPTLRRQFLANGGISPREVIVRMRMNEAKRLLTETSTPLKEIANRVGYGSAIAFNNSFKRSVAITPGEYRRRNRPRG